MSLRADSIGVNGSSSEIVGIIQGKLVTEKNVPEKNIIGNAMAFPIPDAADGLLVHADIMKPMFRNTTLPIRMINNRPAGFPRMEAPNSNIPTPNIITA